jgi:hypothetical protein
MSLLPYFQWCYQTPLGEAIRNSTWLFPVFEAVHLLGLGVVAGAAMIVDLRLLGIGLRKQSAAQLWAGVEPWLIGSVVVMFATGFPLFMSESIKCYSSAAFWIKMTCLLLVLLFTFTYRSRVIETGAAIDRPKVGRFAAITSLVLWFGVAWGGRWIGYGG